MPPGQTLKNLRYLHWNHLYPWVSKLKQTKKHRESKVNREKGLVMNLDMLVTVSTIEDTIRGAKADSSARAAEAEARGTLSEYVSGKAKGLMKTLEVENLANERQAYISLLETYGNKREDLCKLTTDALRKKASGK